MIGLVASLYLDLSLTKRGEEHKKDSSNRVLMLNFRYRRKNSKREQLGSVHGCLPCALEASVSFLEVALRSASFINSPSHTQIELT